MEVKKLLVGKRYKYLCPLDDREYEIFYQGEVYTVKGTPRYSFYMPARYYDENLWAEDVEQYVERWPKVRNKPKKDVC